VRSVCFTILYKLVTFTPSGVAKPKRPFKLEKFQNTARIRLNKTNCIER